MHSTRFQIRWTLALMLALANIAHADMTETCRAGHVCVAASGYENMRAGKPDGGSYGCGFRYGARDDKTGRTLYVALVGGEGDILPYLIVEMHMREPIPDSEKTKLLTPRAGWIYTADQTILTKDWNLTVRDQLQVSRTDILPENRGTISQMAELLGALPHTILVEITEGTYIRYFVAPQSDGRRAAAEFVACVDEIHQSVKSVTPVLR